MFNFLVAFVSLALLIGAFAYVALPVGSRWRRVVVSGGFAVILVALFFGYSDMLGRPKSTRLELLRSGQKDAQVIGSYMIEDQGIYLWLKLPDATEPRYYEIPWDKQTAAGLQKALEDNAQSRGGGVGMNYPFERGWDFEGPKFYALPQPKLPDKLNEDPPTQLYQAPEQGA